VNAIVARLRPPNLRLRLHLMVMILAVFTAALVARAIDVQVWRQSFYQQQGDARFLRQMPIPAYRGSIVDRNGEPLAVSTPVDSIWANPAELLAAPDRVNELAKALSLKPDFLLQRLAQRSDKEFVYLKRQLSPEAAVAITALKIPGVYSAREFKRFYPAGEVLSHVLGLTNIDDRGQEGLELAFDDWLNGKPGAKRVMRDRMGNLVEDVDLLSAAEPGQDLTISIDRRVQYLAYRELKAAILEFNASSGSVVVLDVPTGEILGMVNQPSFNPNAPTRDNTQAMRNRAVTDVLEPGSTVKAFTVAAALESGQFKASTMIDTIPGTLTIAGHTIKDAHNYGVIDVTHVLTKSSNVGASKIALSLPSAHLYDVFKRFGFGQVTGSSFPGESPGILPPFEHWREIEKATISYGYGLNVTPLQLAAAYAALANGGRLKPPTFLKGADTKATAVVDPDLAAQLLKMLETVTSNEGTAPSARIAHYRVAGKTGTSRKASASGYQKRYISLFAGVAPISNPRLAVVIIINDPLGSVYAGGLVAAPVFAKVMGGALRLMNIAPDAPESAAAVMARLQTPTDPDLSAEAVEEEVLR
jgi:cell division protein FtsI (penicillin-binding protein 3)